MWADPVQPRMVAAVTAHEPAQGGYPAAGAHHCTAARRDVEGSLWPWDHVWTVSRGHHIQVVSHGHGCPVLLVGWPSPSCNVEQGQGMGGGGQREDTCNKVQLANAGTECSVFIGGFTPNGLYKEQADSAAHADACIYCCRLSWQLSWHPGSIAQPCRARLYQTPLANAVVLPDKALPAPVLPVRYQAVPQAAPTAITSMCLRGHRHPLAVWAKDPAQSEQHSPKICSAVMTETSLSSRPAVNRTFPFLLLLYIAVIPLN